jgi:hypothetical protein
MCDLFPLDFVRVYKTGRICALAMLQTICMVVSGGALAMTAERMAYTTASGPLAAQRLALEKLFLLIAGLARHQSTLQCCSMLSGEAVCAISGRQRQHEVSLVMPQFVRLAGG